MLDRSLLLSVFSALGNFELLVNGGMVVVGQTWRLRSKRKTSLQG